MRAPGTYPSGAELACTCNTLSSGSDCPESQSWRRRTCRTALTQYAPDRRLTNQKEQFCCWTPEGVEFRFSSVCRAHKRQNHKLTECFLSLTTGPGYTVTFLLFDLPRVFAGSSARSAAGSLHLVEQRASHARPQTVLQTNMVSISLFPKFQGHSPVLLCRQIRFLPMSSSSFVHHNLIFVLPVFTAIGQVLNNAQFSCP